MPARRPFFEAATEVPPLLGAAVAAEKREVFQYVMFGGWPTANSAARVIAAVLAVGASFSFAFIATLTRERVTRSIFAVVLVLTSAAAVAATTLDALALARTTVECAARKCVSEVPRAVLNTPSHRCKCSPDGWFWVTLGVDAVLLAAALSCLALTVRPLLRKT